MKIKIQRHEEGITGACEYRSRIIEKIYEVRMKIKMEWARM